MPSPRDIVEVRKPITDLLYGKYDVLWMKYFKEGEAYERARNFFLNSPKKYEYLVILPDDMIINQKGLDILMKEIQKPTLQGIKKYDVLAGVCCNSLVNDQEADRIAATLTTIPLTPIPQLSTMPPWNNYLTFTILDKMEDKIIKCKYIGFSFYFIHRKIVEKIPFRRPATGHESAKGVDIFFSADLHESGIDQYIHKDARFVHLKGWSTRNFGGLSTNPDVLLVGKYPPVAIFRPQKIK